MRSMAERYREAVMGVQPMETDIVIDRGEGPYLYARDGRRLLDLATGIAVNVLGYGHPAVLAAIDGQVRRHLHVYSGTGYQEALIDYAEALLEEIGPGYRVFFGNSGAEAVEAAIKLARFATGRPAVVAFRGAFHGRSLGALSLTDSAARYRSPYEPLLPSVYHVDYPAPTRLDLSPEAAFAHVERAFATLFSLDVAPERVALVVVEPIQGEGGYAIPPPGFLPWLRALTRRHGILLAVDEVQSGMGRTGRMFGYQHSGVDPDIVIMGKALGGGLPLSAIAARSELADRWPPGAHGTTFGGNPVACAAGHATLRVIRADGLMARALDLGRLALERLGSLETEGLVRDVRGVGLMVAVEFAGDDAGAVARQVVHEGLTRGMILHTAGPRQETIRLMPPLNLEADLFIWALDEIQDIVRASLDRRRSQSVRSHDPAAG